MKLAKVSSLVLSLVAFGSLEAASNVNTSTHKERNFNSGSSLSPFQLRNTTNGNYVKVVSKRLKMFWDEDNYKGNRDTRSAEIWSTMSTFGDVWVGFRLNVPTSSGSVRFPSNKQTIIAQFMQRTNSSGSSTWAVVFLMNNNHLDLEYRGANTQSIITKRVKSNFPRNSWKEIVYHIRPNTRSSAPYNGDVRVWYQGSQVFHEKDVRVCWGGYSNTQKWGMYCADVANYSNGEQRFLYMDDIAAYDGNSNGYGRVNP